MVGIPFSLELFYEMAERSYLLRMVHWAIIRECTRKTVKNLRQFWDWFPAFSVKCLKCGAEYTKKVDRCRCGNITFRVPDTSQLTGVKALLKNPNPSTSFGDIIKRSLLDAQISDDWFISIGYDLTGTIPLSLYHEDPRNIVLCASDDGMLGNGEYFCPIHTHRNATASEKAPGKCRKYLEVDGKRHICGAALIETCYMQVIDGTITARFGRHEMIHGNSYSVGTRLLGNSPMRALVTAIATHMAIDNYNYDAFAMQREPNSALVFMNTSQDEVNRAAEVFRERRLENPHEQLWLGMTEGQAMEYVKMLDGLTDSQTIEERKWLRSIVTSVYGVSPEFVGVETPGRLGSANEVGIHVQNNTTESNQDQVAEEMNRALCPLFKITDWYWGFVPVEPDDEKLQAEIDTLRATAAKTYVEAGFSVVIDEDGMHVTGEGNRLEPPTMALSFDTSKGVYTTLKGAADNPEAVRGVQTTQDDFYGYLSDAYRRALTAIKQSIKGGMSLKQAQRVIASEMSVLEQRLGRKAREWVEEAYKRGLAQAAKDMGVKLKSLAIKEEVVVTFDGRDQEALDWLMANWTGIETSLPDFVRQQRDVFSRIIAEAYQDPSQFDLEAIITRMQEASDAEKYKLERIARSEMTLISNTGRVNGYLKDPANAQRKYDWVPSDGACDDCMAIAQGGPYDIETLKARTNGFRVHPNDRCTVTLHVEGLT